MPCILKERTEKSPGIIVFTHGEALFGVPANFARAKALLDENTRTKRWIYGVQIQADCSWLQEWPLQPWHSFVMWARPAEKYLSNVPQEMISDITCVNFLPNVSPPPAGMARNVDICVISRPSTIKRIYETLLILRALMDRRPDFTATLAVSDPRRIEFGSASYEAQRIDRRFYDLPLKMFSARELKRISFISAPEASFGRFAVAQATMNDLLYRSRFLLLASHKEGVPRVIPEALLTGTPCIVSKSLVSGLSECLNSRNSLAIDDDIEIAAAQIADALSNYDRFEVDIEHIRNNFCEDTFRPKLKTWLTEKIRGLGCADDGRWFLEDLNMRLASHGRRMNLQFHDDERKFFDWMERVETIRPGGAIDPYDEDALFGTEELNRPPKKVRFFNKERVRQVARRMIRGTNV